MDNLLKDKTEIIAWLEQHQINNKGCPASVVKNFHCHKNQLKSLQYCPTYVGKSFTCGSDQLTSLEVCSASINGYFSCYENELTSLENLPTKISGRFDCKNNPLLGSYQDITDFKIIKEKIISDREKSILSTSLHSAVKAVLHKV